MFSGIGGFELGIQRAYNKLQSQTTKKRLQNERWDRDINSQEDSSLLTKESTLCVGYSEIDKYAIQIYEKHFGGHKNYGNARTIKPEEIPDFDLLVGGTPCQDFSIAGKRKGLFKEDGTLTRSGLFYHFIRIANIKRPKFILMENVKGMLSSKNKITGEYNFDNMMELLCEIDYVFDFTVLNSKFFRVPQNRERVFILAIREDLIEKEKII